MRFGLLILVLLFLVIGCGSESSPLGPETMTGRMEDGNTLYFSNGDAYFGFDSASGRFCFWNNKLRRVFCGGLLEYKWAHGGRIKDLEAK